MLVTSVKMNFFNFLQLSDPSNKNYGYLSEELVDHLNVQIRVIVSLYK